MTDLLYTRCTARYTGYLTNHNVPTYHYVFSYRGQYSVVNLHGEKDDLGIFFKIYMYHCVIFIVGAILTVKLLLGVAQGDDLQYIFSDLWGDEFPMSSSDLAFSKDIFVPLLVNFAKTRYFFQNPLNYVIV